MNEENKIPELKDEELEKVSGGSHLSSDETKALQYGDILIIENDLGINLGYCTYLGEYSDPGFGHLLQIKVEINKIYNASGTAKLGAVTLHEGDKTWLSRWDVDFPNRA